MAAKHEKLPAPDRGCKTLPPTPTAVAHPCDESSLRGAVDAGKAGLIAPILVGPAARIEGSRRRPASTSPAFPIVDAPHSQASAEKAVRTGARGQGRGADEGQPAHRRADGRGGQARDRAAHLAARQPLLRDGRAEPRRAADHHRRRGQHRADAGGQGRHRPERDRSRACAGRSRGAGGDPVGDGDGQPQGALDDRGGRAVQDGRPRPDHRRRSSTDRSRSTTRSAWRRPRSRRSTRRSPAAPTCWWCPTSRPATCWRRA